MTSKRTPEQDKAFGAKGGKTTKARHGVDHFKKIAEIGAVKGGEALKEKRGQAHYEKIGKKGGKATLKKHGSDYFRQLALKRHGKQKTK